MKDVSTPAAHALLAQGHVYVDVRSTPEFEAGHPAGAVNIPLIEPDPDSGQMMPNPDFLRVMQAMFAPEAALLIGCQVGGRSARAAMMLEASGFSNVANVRGGFAGGRDPFSGRIADIGWVDAGLPVETGQPAGRAYADVLEKADQSQ